MTKDITPTSIEGIKRLATQMRKSATTSMPHSAALDLAATQAGYQNFAHAHHVLSAGPAVPAKPTFFALISAVWRDRKTSTRGREELRVPLKQPLSNLLKPYHLIRGRNISGYWFAQPDHLQHEMFLENQRQARQSVCGVTRTLAFMEATGLKPSQANTRGFPKGGFQNRPPHCDHYSVWYDAASKVHVLTDEPYPWNDEAGVPEERLAWAKQHGWSIVKSSWGGMHNPGSCDLYLATDAAKGYDLAPIVARLDALPEAIAPEAWSGVSISIPIYNRAAE